MKDILRPFVPEYKGQVTCEDGERILLTNRNDHNKISDIPIITMKKIPELFLTQHR